MDKRYTVKYSDIQAHELNPFKPEFPNNDFRKFKPSEKFEEGFLVNEEGEAFEGLVAKKTHKRVYDRTKFLKLYLQGVCVIPKLSNSALKFFSHIMLDVLSKADCDYVVLPLKDTLVACGYKDKSRIIYYETIIELISKRVIDKKSSYSRDHYWINPNMFFNGDRLEVFNDFEEYFKNKKESLQERQII